MEIDKLYEKYIHPTNKFFSISLWYVHTTPCVDEDETTFFKQDYSLYEARVYQASNPILLYDSNGIINSGTNEYPIRPFSDNFEEFVTWYDHLSLEEKKALERLFKAWGYHVDKEKKINMLRLLIGRMFVPLPRLKNPDLIDELNWKEFVEELISYGKIEKDERIKLILKMLLMRGIYMRYEPHTLLATNPHTGKTEFLEKVGKRLDKVRKDSLIGYAKNKDEIYPGPINNQRYTFTIEQIESQSSPEVIGFLLTFLETGRINWSLGGIDFEVKGVFPLVITANPTGYSTDRIGTFRSLIDHLGSNLLAMGRRFGIIVYGDSYKQIPPSKYDEQEWKKYHELYKALEEYAYPSLKEIYNHEKIKTWLNKAIPYYYDTILTLIDKIYDSEVRDFIRTHSENSYRHLRGGALKCALVDHLPELIFSQQLKENIPEALVNKIIEDSENYLKQLIAINVESVGNMTQLLESEQQVSKIIYQSLPNYIKEIILTVKNYKKITRKEDIPPSINLTNLGSVMTKKYYSYISEVIKMLDRIHDISKYGNYLDKYFGFTIREMGANDYIIEFTNKEKEIQIEDSS